MTDVVAAPAPNAPSAVPAEPTFDGTNESIRPLVEHAADQQETAALLEGFKGRSVESITLEEIRNLPNAEGMTDEELQAIWNEAKGVKATPEVAKEAASTTPKAYKVFVGDAEADIEKMSAKELLAATIEYQANNKAQRKTFDEVVRNAKLGHYNAERTDQLTTQRNQAFTQLRESAEKISGYETRERAITRAFDAALRENYEPLKELLTKYNEAQGEEPRDTKADPSVARTETIQRGYQIHDQVIAPYAQTLATKYQGVSAKEIDDAIMWMVEREPPEAFTPERLEQIMMVEIPHHIEAMLGERGPAPVDPKDAEIATLKEALAKVQGGKASEHNKHVDDVHSRRRNAPPVASALPTSSNVVETPSGMESADDWRTWLRNFKG